LIISQGSHGRCPVVMPELLPLLYSGPVPTIQNEVINACNDFILADVVKKVNAARCFSVLADETEYISGTEQFAMCARYMDCDAGVVREDFLQFVPVFDVTGQSLASVINDSLIKFGVDVPYLCGQGYD